MGVLSPDVPEPSGNAWHLWLHWRARAEAGEPGAEARFLAAESLWLREISGEEI